MMVRKLLVAVCVFALGGASPAVRADDEAQGRRVSYYKEVAPILQEHCQECHRPAGTNYGGMVAPMSLMDYNEVRPWAKSIAQKVKSREMPPWNADLKHRGVFANERLLTDRQIEDVVRWVETGAPRGNPADGPPPRTFENTGGWMIGEPISSLTFPSRSSSMTTSPTSTPVSRSI